MFQNRKYIDLNDQRLQGYARNLSLLDGKLFEVFSQSVFEYYEKFSPRGKKELSYIAANLFELISKKVTDLALGEPFSVTTNKPELQEWLDNWVSDNDLQSTLYQGMLEASATGDMVLKLGSENIYGRNLVTIDNISPEIWFPNYTGFGKPRAQEHSFVYQHKFGNESIYLVETHEKDYIVFEAYMLKANKMEPVDIEEYFKDFAKEYKAKRLDNSTCAIKKQINRPYVYHVKNLPGVKTPFGKSDYDGLDSLVYAICQRLTGNQSILNELANPLLSVPEGTLAKVADNLRSRYGSNNGDLGSYAKEASYFSDVSEVKFRDTLRTARVTEQNSSGQKPEFIHHNADLKNSIEQLNKLTGTFFKTAEIAEVLIEPGKFGQLSGTALRLLAQPTMLKAKRKIRLMEKPLTQAIKTAILLSQQVNDKEFPKGLDLSDLNVSIEFRDGLINDDMHEAQVQNIRLSNGTQSREGAITAMDNVSESAAASKVRQIDGVSADIIDPEDQINEVINTAIQNETNRSQ